MTDSKLERHDIAIGNILYGAAQFITLRLPEEWDIAPGVGRPEISATHERHERRWVACGKAWYVIYHQETGWAMELLVESGPQRALKEPKNGEMISVHNHDAHVRRWQRRRGILRPKMITFVEITYNCEQSDRRIRLELSGRCPAEGFQEIMQYVPKWWCH